MELRSQLENNEWKWKVEKMELLERFDSERKEWECQWKLMQKKIEELYQEVKLRREKNLNGDEGDIQEKILRISLPISQSEPISLMNIDRQSHQSNMVMKGVDKNCKILVNDRPQSNKENKSELKLSNKKHEVCKTESEKWLAQRMSKTENDTLNDALKEIARVSEELCRYQEEIRTRSNCKRTVPDPGEGDSKNKPHIKADRKPVNCPRMSRLKQYDNVNSVKSKSLEAFSPSLAYTSSATITPLVSQDPDLSPWKLSLDIPSSKPPDMNKKSTANLIQNSLRVEDQVSDFSLSNHNDDLFHAQWLCDLGELEDGELTDTLFNNLNANSLTPEMNKQNISLSEDELFCSINLHPDLTLEHSTAGSGYRYFNTIKNGKLAAKIDEFNRTVFKAGKGNSVLDDLLDVVPAIEEKPSSVLKSECPSSEKASVPLIISETSDQACASGSFHNSIKTTKPTAPLSHAFPPQNTSSFHNVLQEHNWKRFNLSGRPRSADSRSNYGVVEKLLKSYETKNVASYSGTKQFHSKWTQSDFLLANNSNTLSHCLERLHLEHKAHVSQNDIQWQPRMDAASLKLPEMFVTKSSDGKGFSRPARPANQRPPSRWASAKSPPLSPPVRRATH
ncbi:uncharacterized protein KIAA0408 homolog isoform X2 [Hyperolius riggenbachi]